MVARYCSFITIIFTSPKVVTEIRSSAPQEEERGKVIDDVLVILQTLLKRTDSLQSLGDLLLHR